MSPENQKDCPIHPTPPFSENGDPNLWYAYVNQFDPGITDTVKNIALRLERMLSITNALQKRREKHIASPNEQPLPAKYAQSLAGVLYQLEQLLLQFCDYSRQRYTSIGKTLADMNTESVCSVEIRVYEDRVMFRLPHLPHRTHKHDLVNIALTSKIYNVLNYPRWGKATMEFCHVYPTRMNWLPCDNDNYSYKRTIDLICNAMRLSDSAATLDLVKRTVFTDELASGTYITVTPKSSDFTDFPKWEDR